LLFKVNGDFAAGCCPQLATQPGRKRAADLQGQQAVF